MPSTGTSRSSVLQRVNLLLGTFGFDISGVAPSFQLLECSQMCPQNILPVIADGIAMTGCIALPF